jgi:spore coat protein U-like protein
MKRIFVLVMLVALTGVTAFANTQSTTMQVTATLLPTVSVSTTNLNFGTWVITDNLLYSSATVTVQATAGTNYAITMDAGKHFDGVYRNVANGAYNVPFLIFDPTNKFLWGDAGYAGTYAAGSPVTSTGTGSPQTFTANGQLSAFIANPASPIGVYSDSVMVTVNY